MPSNFTFRTTGIGYLTRLRRKRSRRGGAYWILSLTALRGSIYNLRCTRLDCIASSAEAIAAVELLQPLYEACQDKAGLPVRFEIDGLCPRLPANKRGAGFRETRIFLNASLVQLSLCDRSALPGNKEANRAFQRSEFEDFSCRLGYSAGSATALALLLALLLE